ncbi:GspE/PulE family protein [Steroidobacter sp.]|uniref:GspE/PulE family protein n=1 Tax=Steroidobacter sp. TaxID=1978227 RepID=UPI001A3CE2A1|nr:type II/IV secretion system protein [Steroidobacter sp.]MBL8264973.1 Flp pilus assembly complex ATPase component TadA [Steroidobacter sp.]
METPAVASSKVRWPTVPFFDSAAPTSNQPLECIVELANGRTLDAQLVAFTPGTDYIELRLPDRKGRQKLNLAPVRCITLPQPMKLVPDQTALSAVGGSEDPLAHEREFTVHMRQGAPITGKACGFVREQCGLFLFVVEPDTRGAVRRFIPAPQIAEVSIGPPLGEALVGKALISSSALENALDRQNELRREPLGKFLADRAIITSEQLTQTLAEQQRRPNVRLGDLLVEAKLISPSVLDEALGIQAEHRERRLGDILIDMGAVSLRLIQMALSEKLGIPYVNVREFKVDPLGIELVEPAFAIRHQMLPLLRSGSSLIVAVENPLTSNFAQELRVITGLTIVLVIADPADLKARISKEYSRLDTRNTDFGGAQGRGGSGRDPIKADVAKVEDLAMQLSRETPRPASVTKARDSEARVNENTLVRLVNKIIKDAHTQGASDIHIESNAATSTRVRFRLDGDLTDYLDLPPAYRNSLVSRIKVMADLDISEHRQPQDGKIDFSKFGELEIELRVAIIPTANNLEDVVLRILASMEPHPLEDLQFAARDLLELRKMIARSYGIVLVVGPTGSGKTTTLHSMLREINRPDLKIWTAEDPIEITQAGLRQVQVQPKIDWTFAAAMRAFLRADPDVIMVGEMRDAETAKIGIEASLTGHLVLSTLHTNSAAESITRLLDLGMDPFNFADALLGILSQRLVRTLCTNCKRGRLATDSELAELAEEYCGEFQQDRQQVLAHWRLEHQRNGGITLYEAVGCDACRDGYKGRVGIYELLIGTPQLKHLVRSRAPIPQLVQAAHSDGMSLLRQDAITKVLQGRTDLVSARAASS